MENSRGRCFAICDLLSATALALLALRAFAEELERMADFGKSVAFADRLFDLCNWAGVHHQRDPATPGTDEVIIVLLGIEQLEIAAGPVKMDALGDVELFQDGHYPKDRGVVRGDTVSNRPMLDLF